MIFLKSRASISRFAISPNRYFAVRPFKLPDIGEGIAEVQVMEWFVKEGDRVNEMDKLCLVESDKASVEITSRYQGVIKSILVPAHEQAKVGSVIVEIDDEQAGSEPEEPAAKLEQSNKPKASSPVATSSAGSSSRPQHGNGNGEVKAAPAVRALAKSLGIDLHNVTGTGKDAKITEQDVQNFKSRSDAPSRQSTESLEAYGPSEQVKLSQVGLAMVKSMNDSLRVPMLTHSDEIECDRLAEVIKELKPIAQNEFKLPSLTLTAFFIKAVSLGVEQYPIINSRMSSNGDSYYLMGQHNVSVAMDSPRGLVVPNIKNVQLKTIIQIQKELHELQQRAKSGRLSFDDIRGGTVSFSNIGVIGGTYAKPVIFDGQAVIGAVGRMIQLPRFEDNGQVVPRRIMNVSWTADHRHVDGASVARFSNVFRDVIENPEQIVALHFK